MHASALAVNFSGKASLHSKELTLMIPPSGTKLQKASATFGMWLLLSGPSPEGENTKEYRGIEKQCRGIEKSVPTYWGPTVKPVRARYGKQRFFPSPRPELRGRVYRNAGGVKGCALVGPVVNAGDCAGIAPDVGDGAEHANQPVHGEKNCQLGDVLTHANRLR
jgi:hypothetical protein